MILQHLFFRNYTVLLGVHNFLKCKGVQHISVEQAFPHEDYDVTDLKNDIMLLKVKQTSKQMLFFPVFVSQYMLCCNKCINCTKSSRTRIFWYINYIFKKSVSQVVLQSKFQCNCEPNQSTRWKEFLYAEVMHGLWLGEDRNEQRISISCTDGSQCHTYWQWALSSGEVLLFWGRNRTIWGTCSFVI